MKTRTCGKKERESGSTWLVCLKVVTLAFAIGLFSTAIWYRHGVHNRVSTESEPVFIRTADHSELLDERDEAEFSGFLGISGSKSLATLPSDFSFTQPDSKFQANPFVDLNSSLDGDSIDALIEEAARDRNPVPIAAWGSKAGMVILPEDFEFSQPSESPGYPLVRDGEIIEFEGFIDYGEPIDVPESESPPSGPGILISGSKSIAMPIFSTRAPPAAEKKEQKVLMSSSKLGRVLGPAEMTTIVSENLQWASVPPEAQVRPEPILWNVRWSDGPNSGVSFSPSIAGPFDEVEESRWQQIIDWDDPAGWIPGEKPPTGFRFGVDSSVVTPLFHSRTNRH